MSSTTEHSQSEPNSYSPISCGDYDYLEMMCMFRYRVVLSLEAHGCVQILVGTAVDLKVRSPYEFLKVMKDSGTVQELRVDRIRHVRVLTQPSRFSEHRFGLAC